VRDKIYIKRNIISMEFGKGRSVIQKNPLFSGGGRKEYLVVPHLEEVTEYNNMLRRVPIDSCGGISSDYYYYEGNNNNNSPLSSGFSYGRIILGTYN
jgi:hypothetical protein